MSRATPRLGRRRRRVIAIALILTLMVLWPLGQVRAVEPERVDRWFGVWKHTTQGAAHFATTQARSGNAEVFVACENSELKIQIVHFGLAFDLHARDKSMSAVTMHISYDGSLMSERYAATDAVPHHHLVRFAAEDLVSATWYHRGVPIRRGSRLYGYTAEHFALNGAKRALEPVLAACGTSLDELASLAIDGSRPTSERSETGGSTLPVDDAEHSGVDALDAAGAARQVHADARAREAEEAAARTAAATAEAERLQAARQRAAAHIAELEQLAKKISRKLTLRTKMCERRHQPAERCWAEVEDQRRVAEEIRSCVVELSGPEVPGDDDRCWAVTAD